MGGGGNDAQGGSGLIRDHAKEGTLMPAYAVLETLIASPALLVSRGRPGNDGKAVIFYL